MELARIGRVALEKYFLQAQRSQLLRERLGHAPVLAENQLGAASADVVDQNALAGVWPAALHTEVNEPRLLLAGDDFHLCLQRVGGAFQNLALLSGVA